MLREFSTASVHFEQAGHARYQGGVENNIAVFFLEIERFAEAHEHLDRAQALYTSLNDSLHLARLDDSRARALLGEGAILKAAQISDAAAHVLEKSDQYSALAEVLTTRGVALARLKQFKEALDSFECAIEIAEQAGDLEKAGLATLALIEELPDHLTEVDLLSIFERARGFLKFSQNTITLRRLTECAWRALSVINTARPEWKNFSLGKTLNRHEGRFIQMALEDSGGSVTKAAALLGLPGHQSLNFILHRRHPELLNARSPIKPRRRSIIKEISSQVTLYENESK